MGIQINGQTDTVTATDGSINVGGNLNVPGVLTYDDVTSIDSVGVVTARNSLHVTGGSVGIGTDSPNKVLKVEYPDPGSGSDGLTQKDTGNDTTTFFGTVGPSYNYIGHQGHAGMVYSSRDLAIGVDHNNNGVIKFYTGNNERLRITSAGTLESYSSDDTTPNIKFRSNDTNWHGALNQSVHGGTITSFLSCGGDWDANGTTYNCTKNLAAYPSSAIAVHNQYNNSWGSEFVFLTKAGGSSTTDGAVTEKLRIDSSGNITLGFAGNSLYFQNGFNNSTARIQNGGGSNNSELKFLVRNAGTESEKMRLTSTAGLAVVTAGSMPANAGNETLYIQGEGHNGHGTSNTRSVVSIIGALTSNSNGAGLWVGTRTNENTAVIGTRTASGNLAIETYSGGWGERLRITSAGQMILGTATNLGSVPPKLTIVNNTNSSTFSECQLLRLNGPSGVGERGGIGFHYAQSLDYGEKPSSFIGVETVAAGGAQQTDLLFATRPNTLDNEPTERLRITSTGHKWTNNGSIFHGSNDITDFTQASRDSYNNISIRAGRQNAGTTPTNDNSAIKIYPAGVRSATTGNLTGGIAWQHLDPNNANWGSNYGSGSQIWMGAALHDTPGQERDRFNLWMNSGTTGNSNPNQLAIEAYPNGMVRHPKVPAFMVRSSNNSGAFSGGAIATWNVTILNNGSGFANGKFTAPINGIYYFSCMMLSQAGTRLFHEFRVNGTRVDGTRSEGHAVSNSYQTNTITMTYSLSASDYVEIYVGPNAGYGGTYTNFNGFLIG